MKNPTVQQVKQHITRLTQARQYAEAKRLAEQLVQQVPQDIEAWFGLSQLQEHVGEFEACIRSLYQVCQAPSSVYAESVAKAVQLSTQHGFDQLGIAPAQQLLKLKPQDADAFYQLGCFLANLEQYQSAKPHFERAVSLDASLSDAWHRLALCRLYTGDIVAAIEAYDQQLEQEPDDVNAAVLRAMGSNYSLDLNDARVYSIHQSAASILTERAARLEVSDLKSRSKKRIRVGYVSPDFRLHSVAYFFLALVESHRRDRFEVYCYSDNLTPDSVTERIRSASDHWRDSSEHSSGWLARRIQDDQIDILVDLTGYTSRSRLEVFALRVAPVQLTYLGYPNTTALETMDYRLTDGWADPEGQSEAYYSERLIRLPGGFLCYSVLGDEPEVSTLPLETSDGPCFGAFNSFFKITRHTLEQWAEILKRVPSSTLFIKTKPLAEEALRESVWAQMAELGVSRERVRLQGWAPEVDSHLALYGQVDIHLDTSPYNGTTTTIESLRQGVPVVTLAGQTHRSRVSASILSQIDLTDLVADSSAEYVEIAVELARDLDRLKQLRGTLRERVETSSLMDRERFIDELEKAYEIMVKEVVNH